MLCPPTAQALFQNEVGRIVGSVANSVYFQIMQIVLFVI